MTVRETVRLTLVRVVTAATRRELEEDIAMMTEELEEEGWEVRNAKDEDLEPAEAALGLSEDDFEDAEDVD
jgi:hypothetical protein